MEAARKNTKIEVPIDRERNRLSWSRAILAFIVVETTGFLGGFLGVASLNIEWIWGTGTFCSTVCAVFYLIPATILMLLTRFRFSKKVANLSLVLLTVPALILASCISYWLAIAMAGI